ncbi:CheR family methyltransferase [Sandarakinorhabdus sp.]|uniref:CheR family methyltransferase n=1 Tax=Sandarakinorhabdus sp. TaxID=1916663 RepID=UPI00286DA30F|nr:CheR family methyltransferase [Sandarakinorhabdus sp.]
MNETVLKGLMASRDATDEIRIWVPGCATGEEAYTIAILLREAMDTRRPRPKIHIFGTDLDERAIAKARVGHYRKPIAGLSAERLERWFTVDGDGYCVAPEIREMCVFSAHSVIKHPPFSKLDLVSCRNLLIYLDAPMQDRVIRTFHYALKPGGKLFLGLSESVSRATKLFGTCDKRHRIFERRDVLTPSLPPFSAGHRTAERAAVDTGRLATDEQMDKDVRRIMEKHSPPYLLLDRANKIVRFSGGAAGPYLEPSPGPASFALLDILRKSLRPAAREVLQQVRSAGEPVRRDEVPIRIDGKPRLVSIVAERLAASGPESDYVVLALHDAGPGHARAKAGDDGAKSTEDLHALEQELRTTRTQLQSTIDELETTNEEMKSSNEEYQSVNEELQSSNEELETAKEEMQSVNEELQTINGEIGSKNEQLTLLNSDLSNFLESTEIATLFLDQGLRVRRFTRGVNEVFHLRDADIGRPITEIVNLLDYRELQRDVKAVLRNLSTVERQVAVEGAKTTYTLRIRPYRTVANVIDGVVMTFVDITGRQAADEAMRISEAKFRMLFDVIDEGFCTMEKIDTRPGAPSDYRYLSANPGLVKQSGVTDIVGKTIQEVAPNESQGWCDIYDKVWETGEPVRFEREFISQGRFLGVYAFRFDEAGQRRLGTIFLDISDRRRHEDQQELLLKEMDHRIKNLFAVTGSIVSLSVRSAKSPKDMAETIQGRLRAMAASHDLVRPRGMFSGVAATKTSLAEILETILRPHVGASDVEGSVRVLTSGPAVTVSGDAVTSLSMVLHELATNATKYGALSAPGGRVEILWEIRKQRLELTWTEHGGPRIDGPPEHKGFGTMLARNSIAGQLDGQIRHDWNSAGLVVHLSVASERLAPPMVEARQDTP